MSAIDNHVKFISDSPIRFNWLQKDANQEVHLWFFH
jgi:hypothetical protein